MRHALPLFWCLDYDTQVKLAKMLDDKNSIPRCEWKEWSEFMIDVMPMDIRDIEEAKEYYDREMRKAPHKPARVK